MTNILSRVDILLPIEKLLQLVVGDYHLGQLKNFSFIEKGYEDLNIKLTTSSGIYVVKIFTFDRSEGFIKSYVNALLEFIKKGIPVPVLQKYNDKLYYSISGKKQLSFLCVMNFFDGNNFTEIRPSVSDFITITKYIAKLNTCSFLLTPAYDSWGTANLVKEFSEKKKFLNRKDMNLIEPVLNLFKELNLSHFHQSIIHGDLQREHVFKNHSGDYFILDFGCMNNAASILGLSIFLAQFTIDIGSSEEIKEIIKLCNNEYQKINPLPIEEMDQIPLLMQATYAIYLIASSYQIEGKNNPNKESLNWQSFGRKGLIKVIDW